MNTKLRPKRYELHELLNRGKHIKIVPGTALSALIADDSIGGIVFRRFDELKRYWDVEISLLVTDIEKGLNGFVNTVYEVEGVKRIQRLGVFELTSSDGSGLGQHGKGSGTL
jgi:hypothetical protein